MAQPATKKSEPITPSAVVTVNNEGHPSKNPVQIPSGGSLQFVNPQSNTNNFIIQLWDPANERHPVISVYLPAGDDVIFMDDPESNSQNGICPYNVIAVRAATHVGNPATGGNNRIIVGSGRPTSGK